MLDDVKITINGHMWFCVDDRYKIFWHSPDLRRQDELNFMKSLSSFKKIKFGWLCNLDKKMMSLKKQIST